MLKVYSLLLNENPALYVNCKALHLILFEVSFLFSSDVDKTSLLLLLHISDLILQTDTLCFFKKNHNQFYVRKKMPSASPVTIYPTDLL